MKALTRRRIRVLLLLDQGYSVRSTFRTSPGQWPSEATHANSPRGQRARARPSRIPPSFLKSARPDGEMEVVAYGIERMRGLRYLAAQDNPLRDLRGLSELRHLFLEGTEVDSLEVLSGHTRLRRLWIYGTRVTDLSSLAGCESLDVEID